MRWEQPMTMGSSEQSLQVPFDVAVVIPTVLRTTLTRAVRSVFTQEFDGRIQILIGIDKASGPFDLLEGITSECPGHCAVSVLHLGYSTSARNGGLYPGGCGGALRSILSYAANSRLVAYLDDDNWWREDHLATLRSAMIGREWAFSYRWYVDDKTSAPLCPDEWESVGPDRGVFKERFGGFVDPSSLMLDKLACEEVLRWWCYPIEGDGRAMSEDRNVFRMLCECHSWGATGLASCYYVIHPDDCMHLKRLRWIEGKKDIRWDRGEAGCPSSLLARVRREE